MSLLRAMIRNRGIGIGEVCEHLDQQTHDQRVASITSLGWRDQRELYQMAGASSPLSISHFVPDDVDDLVGVRHVGKNSLPVIPSVRRFEKVFCRPRGDRSRLFGFNESNTRKWIGPGYFVLIPTESSRGWEHRGSHVVDYLQVPNAPVPSNWPKVVPNTHGLQRFVFHGTRDFMRRVSDHVSVGAAFSGEFPIEMFFVLCRLDEG